MIRLFLSIQVVLIVSLSQAQNITVDTILHRHFEAVGGLEHWQQMNTCYAEQSYWSIPIDQPPHRRFLGDQLPKNQKNYYQYPGRYRGNVYQDGELTTAIIDNDDEAKFYSYRSKRELIYSESDHEHVKAVHALTFATYLVGPTPLLVEAYRDSVLTYEGKSEAYGRLCHKLIVTDGLPLGGAALIYLDAKTYRAHALVHAKAIDRHKIYDNYQAVNGLLIPHQISTYKEGERYEEYTIDKIEINQFIDPSVFAVW